MTHQLHFHINVYLMFILPDKIDKVPKCHSWASLLGLHAEEYLTACPWTKQSQISPEHPTLAQSSLIISLLSVYCNL